MELNVYENMTKNSTFDPDESVVLPTNYYLEIPIAIIALLSTIANALIVIVVIRFPILHTRFYSYLVSWSICNFIVSVSAPATLNLLGFGDVISAKLFCLWTKMNLVFMLGDLIFIAGIALDWYIITFSGQSCCAVRCKRFHKSIIAGIWITLLILLIYSIISCLIRFHMPLPTFLYMITYFTVFALIIALLILRIIKLKVSSIVVEKSNLELKLIVSYFLCWLPHILGAIHYLIMFPQGNIVYEYLTYLISQSNACIFLTLLYYNDRRFKICLRKFLKSSPSSSEFEEDSVKEADNTFIIGN